MKEAMNSQERQDGTGVQRIIEPVGSWRFYVRRRWWPLGRLYGEWRFDFDFEPPPEGVTFVYEFPASPWSGRADSTFGAGDTIRVTND